MRVGRTIQKKNSGGGNLPKHPVGGVPGRTLGGVRERNNIQKTGGRPRSWETPLKCEGTGENQQCRQTQPVINLRARPPNFPTKQERYKGATGGKNVNSKKKGPTIKGWTHHTIIKGSGREPPKTARKGPILEKKKSPAGGRTSRVEQPCRTRKTLRKDKGPPNQDQPKN